MVRIRTIVLVALLLPSLACAAQIPGLTSKPAAKSTPSANVPADPLGRGTPHGTVLGFLHAAQDENYSIAAQYFRPATGHRRLDPTEEQDLAAQLLAVINQKILTSSLESLSDDPQGRLDDGLPPNQELLTGVRESNGVFSIELLRLDDDHGNKLWYISRKTLDSIPETYDSLQFSDIEKKLPSYLSKHRFLTMPLWQWIAILVAFRWRSWPDGFFAAAAYGRPLLSKKARPRRSPRAKSLSHRSGHAAACRSGSLCFCFLYWSVHRLPPILSACDLDLSCGGVLLARDSRYP